ncbi:hypothetical protein [Acrocarpospora catenulata]|uniref:hypothetical protein n=1 Tax=Acrocarpospora catenulata TaxID=2836182 RepID=UPI001BD99D22|nr:hypothetical protein [Acrocarpospora catenulata]
MQLASRIAAAGICLAALAGCSSEPPPPTFAEATQNLVRDGEKLLASHTFSQVGRFQITEKAEKDSDTGCIPGSRQRFFRAQGNFLPDGTRTPGTASLVASGYLGLMKYDKLVDSLDFWDNNLSVIVVHNPESAVTFMVAARPTEPNILVVGKTDCFESEEG